MRRPSVLGLFVTVVMVASLLPILVVILTSFNSTSLLSFPPQGIGIAGYQELLHNSPFLQSFRLSFVVACCVSATATVLGVLGAMALMRYRFPGRDAVSTFLMSPLMLPTIAIGLAMLLLSARLGLSGSVGVIWVAHLVVVTPYVIRVVGASLSGFDGSLERAARSLGASPLQAFFRVILPIIRPGVIAAAVLGFLVSWNEVNIAAFLAGGDATTLPVRILGAVTLSTASTMISAVSALLAIITWIVLILIERTVGLNERLPVK